MDEKKFKRFSRQELLEILVEQGREIEKLEKELQQAQQQLQNRMLKQQSAGTMAEAALQLNDIFDRADVAAGQYVENARRYEAEQRTVYEQEVNRARRRAAEILAEAETERQRRIEQAGRYWENLTRKLTEFYREHPGLREELEKTAGKTGK